MAHLALDPDPPAVQLHELLGERQAEPRALLRAGVLPANLAELLEDGRLVLGRDPDPRVADGDGDDASAAVAVRPTRPPSGVNFTALERRFSRICFTFRSSATMSPTRCPRSG